MGDSQIDRPQTDRQGREADVADPQGSRPTLAIAVTVVWGALLLPGLLGAALSPMFFDAPGSMSNPGAIANALIVVSFPILCIVSIAATWSVWFVQRRRLQPFRSVQLAAAFLPLIPIGYFAVVMIVGTASVIFSGQPLGLHSTIIKH